MKKILRVNKKTVASESQQRDGNEGIQAPHQATLPKIKLKKQFTNG